MSDRVMSLDLPPEGRRAGQPGEVFDGEERECGVVDDGEDVLEGGGRAAALVVVVVHEHAQQERQGGQEDHAEGHHREHLVPILIRARLHYVTKPCDVGQMTV